MAVKVLIVVTEEEGKEIKVKEDKKERNKGYDR